MTTATQRSLFAELDEMTDREIHDRIKPTRPPFISPMRKAEAALKARHAAELPQDKSGWKGSGMPTLPQRMELHARHPACLLLFRIGDFYELFDENARTVSALCGLPLTVRQPKGEAETPMAGFPYHQLDTYLKKLIRSGQRVALCETPAD